MIDESDNTRPVYWSETDGPRLPRIALMGEFSAGKSTLANLMIGTNPLPVQVVATQLPPVLISFGSSPSVIVDLSGNETPCDMAGLQEIDPESVAFIRFFCDADILTRCDLIDMPGISDPNMSSAVWERVLPYADGVIWCTPATQAWRQSEAAVWDGVDDTIRLNSMLVVTRADMLLTDKDRAKVLKRVKTEAGGLFAATVMMSLTNARESADDVSLWEQSGVDDFVEKFLEMIDTIDALLPGIVPDAPACNDTGSFAPPTPQSVAKRPVARQNTRQDQPVSDAVAPDPSSYMPKFS